MYLVAESFVIALDAAEPHSLKLLKSSLTKEQPSGAPNENILQNHLNIALLNVF